VSDDIDHPSEGLADGVPIIDLPPPSPERRAAVARALARIILRGCMSAEAPGSDTDNHQRGAAERTVA
jgi:hypothetical protein